MDGFNQGDSHECKDKVYRAWLCELANEVWALKERVTGLENGQATANIVRDSGDSAFGEQRRSVLEINGG